MKIRINKEYKDEGFYEWVESNDPNSPLVEVPDAIVEEWRALTRRQAEINFYLTKYIEPELDAEYEARRQKWREAHPVEAARDDAIAERWSRTMLKEALNPTRSWLEQMGQTFKIFDDDEK